MQILEMRFKNRLVFRFKIQTIVIYVVEVIVFLLGYIAWNFLRQGLISYRKNHAVSTKKEERIMPSDRKPMNRTNERGYHSSPGAGAKLLPKTSKDDLCHTQEDDLEEEKEVPTQREEDLAQAQSVTDAPTNQMESPATQVPAMDKITEELVDALQADMEVKVTNNEPINNINNNNINKQQRDSSGNSLKPATATRAQTNIPDVESLMALNEDGGLNTAQNNSLRFLRDGSNRWRLCGVNRSTQPPNNDGPYPTSPLHNRGPDGSARTTGRSPNSEYPPSERFDANASATTDTNRREAKQLRTAADKTEEFDKTTEF